MPNTQYRIPYQSFGHKGSVIHFAHANGFPPKVYQHFLQPFSNEYQIIASKFRPLWGNQSPSSLKHWDDFADDLIRFLDEQGLKNIIGMGHSLGGTVSMIAAMKRPDLFSKLILLDPVVFGGGLFELVSYLPNALKRRIIPVAKISNKRRDQWDSKEQVYELWRIKRVFKKLSNTVLKNLIEHAITPMDNGKVGLTYSREWETQVYVTAPMLFKHLKKVKTPMIIIKGAQTDVITPKIWEAWKKIHPSNHFINFQDAGHLVPFEHPEELAKEILKRLKA